MPTLKLEQKLRTASFDSTENVSSRGCTPITTPSLSAQTALDMPTDLTDWTIEKKKRSFSLDGIHVVKCGKEDGSLHGNRSTPVSGRYGGLFRDKSLLQRVFLLLFLYGGNITLDLFGVMLMPAAVVKVIRTPKPLYADFILWLFYKIRSGRLQLLAMILTVVGAVLTAWHNPHINSTGLLCTSLATVFSAGHFVLAALIMDDNGVEPLSLMMMLTVPVAIILFPIFIYSEGISAVATFCFDQKHFHTVLLTLLAISFFTFAHSILAWYLIRYTSPVYCTVLMCAKVPLLVLVTVPLFGVVLPTINWCGIVLACIAFAWYAVLEYYKTVDYRSKEEVRMINANPPVLYS
eukprot:g3385.t1